MTKAKNLAERAAEGDFDLVVPLDYLILDEMTAPGTMLAGLYELGTTTKEIARKYNAVSPGTVAARARNMGVMGMCRKVKLVGAHTSKSHSGHTAWQRTELGDKMLQEWKGATAIEEASTDDVV